MANKCKGKRVEVDDLPDDTGVISNFGDDEDFSDDSRYEIMDRGDKALEAAFGQDLEYEVTLMRLLPEMRNGKQLVAPIDIRFRQLSMAEIVGLQRGEKTDTSNRINPKLWQRRAYTVLKAGILSHEIVNCDRFKADYANGEISIQDFNPNEINLLWEMIAPGMQKSREDITKRSLSVLRVARKDVQAPADTSSPAL